MRSEHVPSAPGVFNLGAGKAAYRKRGTVFTLGGTINVREAVAEARDAPIVLTDAWGAVELIAGGRLDLVPALLADREFGRPVICGGGGGVMAAER